VVAAFASAAAIRPEPRDARLLVETGGAVVAVAPDGSRRNLLSNAADAAYSPDGTLVAFVRRGDLWLANADGSGQRRLARTPDVDESGPAWLPDGSAIVYTARVNGARQIRLLSLPTGPSRRIAASDTEEYAPAISHSGRLAFVSWRSGAPTVYVAQTNGVGAAAFDTTAPATPPVDIRDLAWSPDGSRLAYTVQAEDGSTEVVVDDGTTQTPLSAAPARDEHPVWAPDGSRIAFDDGAGNLVSLAADGSGRRALGLGQPLDWRVVPVGRPLFPNLVQRPPGGLVVTRSPLGRWLLGFTSMVDNRGPGILWIRGTRAPGAHVMQVRQLVKLAGGGTRALPDSGQLHYAVAPPHYHWHFIGFDRYELRRAADYALLVRDHKSGFCLADHYGTARGVPHGPPRFLGNCAQFHPFARSVEEGSSVGYTDRYPAFFHGQALDVTHVPPGRYWLVHRVNADFHLREEHYGDDAASLLVQISWPAGRNAAPRVTTLRVCARERC
jgi:Tol biopolymer transport system component